MSAYVLVLLAFSYHGKALATIDFEDKAMCELAVMQLQAEIKSGNGGISATCVRRK